MRLRLNATAARKVNLPDLSKREHARSEENPRGAPDRRLRAATDRLYESAMRSDRVRRRAQRPTAYALVAALASALLVASVAGILRLAGG